MPTTKRSGWTRVEPGQYRHEATGIDVVHYPAGWTAYEPVLSAPRRPRLCVRPRLEEAKAEALAKFAQIVDEAHEVALVENERRTVEAALDDERVADVEEARAEAIAEDFRHKYCPTCRDTHDNLVDVLGAALAADRADEPAGYLYDVEAAHTEALVENRRRVARAFVEGGPDCTDECIEAEYDDGHIEACPRKAYILAGPTGQLFGIRYPEDVGRVLETDKAHERAIAEDYRRTELAKADADARKAELAKIERDLERWPFRITDVGTAHFEATADENCRRITLGRMKGWRREEPAVIAFWRTLGSARVRLRAAGHSEPEVDALAVQEAIDTAHTEALLEDRGRTTRHVAAEYRERFFRDAEALAEGLERPLGAGEPPPEGVAPSEALGPVLDNLIVARIFAPGEEADAALSAGASVVVLAPESEGGDLPSEADLAMALEIIAAASDLPLSEIRRVYEWLVSADDASDPPAPLFRVTQYGIEEVDHA